jgi:hypothetical protein
LPFIFINYPHKNKANEVKKNSIAILQSPATWRDSNPRSSVPLAEAMSVYILEVGNLDADVSKTVVAALAA